MRQKAERLIQNFFVAVRNQDVKTAKKLLSPPYMNKEDFTLGFIRTWDEGDDFAILETKQLGNRLFQHTMLRKRKGASNPLEGGLKGASKEEVVFNINSIQAKSGDFFVVPVSYRPITSLEEK